MTQPLLNDPDPLVLLDMRKLENALESKTASIQLAYPNNAGQANAVEIYGLLVGPTCGGALDATLRIYRCPEGDGMKWDTAPYATVAIPYSGGTVPGAEEVTNGTFAADTDWEKGNGWSIGGGVATHAAGGSKSAIAQTVGTSKAWYLLVLDITGLSAGSLVARVGHQRVKAFTSTGVKQAALFYRDTTLGEERLELWADAGASVGIDNVSLTNVTPYRFSDVRVALQADGQAASGVGFGILPGGDLSNDYASLYVRRFVA